MGDILTYIIFNLLTEAEALNKKINDYMKLQDPTYNTVKWCNITTDKNGHYSVYIKTHDNRKPIDALDSNEKLLIINKLPKEYLTDNKYNQI